MTTKNTYESYILAVWPHPDDVEIGAWGVLTRSAAEGKKNVIIDLTPSQLSTHGDPNTRISESMDAAAHLWVFHRENLMLEDGKICDDCDARMLLVKQIRLHKPEIVLMPWKDDRHPDHECAAELVKNAVFMAWLTKVDVDGLEIHKPRLLMYYMIRQNFSPDIIIPLTEAQYNKKIEAFTTYESQKPTNGRWLEYVQARHIMHGHEIWQKYGEGFKTYSHGIGVESFDNVMNWFF